MFRNINNFLKDESGQGAVEYMLILAAAITIVLVFKSQIIEQVKALAEKVGTELNESVDKILEH